MAQVILIGIPIPLPVIETMLISIQKIRNKKPKLHRHSKAFSKFIAEGFLLYNTKVVA